jgi:hypothetical protein
VIGVVCNWIGNLPSGVCRCPSGLLDPMFAVQFVFCSSKSLLKVLLFFLKMSASNINISERSEGPLRLSDDICCLRP